MSSALSRVLTDFNADMMVRPANERKNAAACRYLGNTYQKLDKPAEAVKSYQQAIELVETLDEQPDWADEVRRTLAELQE